MYHSIILYYVQSSSRCLGLTRLLSLCDCMFKCTVSVCEGVCGGVIHDSVFLNNLWIEPRITHVSVLITPIHGSEQSLYISVRIHVPALFIWFSFLSLPGCKTAGSCVSLITRYWNQRIDDVFSSQATEGHACCRCWAWDDSSVL